MNEVNAMAVERKKSTYISSEKFPGVLHVESDPERGSMQVQRRRRALSVRTRFPSRPSTFEITLDVIGAIDLRHLQVAVLKSGVTQTEAEFESRGDVFLVAYCSVELGKFNLNTYRVEVSVIDFQALRVRYRYDVLCSSTARD